MAKHFIGSAAVSASEQVEQAQAFPSGSRRAMKKKIHVKSAAFVHSILSSSMCIT